MIIGSRYCVPSSELNGFALSPLASPGFRVGLTAWSQGASARPLVSQLPDPTQTSNPFPFE